MELPGGGDAHWLPCEKDTFVVNDFRDGKFVAVVRNWRTGAERIYFLSRSVEETMAGVKKFKDFRLRDDAG